MGAIPLETPRMKAYQSQGYTFPACKACSFEAVRIRGWAVVRSHDGVLRCIGRRGVPHSLANVAHHGRVALWAAGGLGGAHSSTPPRPPVASKQR